MSDLGNTTSLDSSFATPARIPVGGSTLYTIAYGGGGNLLQALAWQFTNEQFTTASEVADIFFWQNGVGTLSYGIRIFYRKVSEQEYLESIVAAYDKYNVPPFARSPVPFTDNCIVGGGVCPTEAKWCEIDPNCSVRLLHNLFD